MERFKNILFVYDGEKESGAALTRAVSLAKRNDAILTLVIVHEDFPPEMQMAISASDVNDFQGGMDQESRKHLKHVVKRIEKRGVQVKGKVLWGTPFIEIIKEVLRNNHDLVMISPQKRPRLKEMLFGSRTMHLMRKCPCPVWVIKPTQPKRYARILAAVDAAPVDDERALLNIKIMELATSLGRIEKCQLHIMHCWRPYTERTIRGRSLLRENEAEKLVREAKDAHKRWLNELVEKFDLEGLKHKVHLLMGDADELIPRFVSRRRVELVVMGTVSRTGLAGFFIGNTAEKVLHRLNCSVLAVKPDGFATPVKLDK